ncbi:hypothetical protein [Pseudonocardia sp. N23]|uniref:hypothetical protein n=1 Tax=Pseudonocardia sp. N23 TaxID=1987376 RepID=UPI000BFCD891|nr:hypothetical protein [Pseudonocardia sp. N23]GAY12256.1 hypothetical protein TOK_0648 [Pseudonocardia sp. N23]
MRVVPRGNVVDRVELVELLRRKTLERVGAVEVRVEVVSELERSRTGKTPFILQRMTVPRLRAVPVGDVER